MSEKFTWKAEITFVGTAEEFANLAEILEDAPIQVAVSAELEHPGHWAGIQPLPIGNMINPGLLKKLTAKRPAHQIRFIRDFPGGIRTAHVHLDDGSVVFLDREGFRELAGEVAKNLAMNRVESINDYVEVMAPIAQIAPRMP